jgi:hypothetical protein
VKKSDISMVRTWNALGKNIISGPAMANTDIALMRNFTLPGREGLR